MANMQPNGGAAGNRSGSTGGAGQQTSAELNQIVIEYLLKKGYHRTESTLRLESMGEDAEGRPTIRRGGESASLHKEGMQSLKSWVEGTLDLYKPELQRMLWPIFVYSYLNLVAGWYDREAKELLASSREFFVKEHEDELRHLDALGLPDHVQHADIARKYRGSRYRVTLSKMGHELLISHLEDNQARGGSIIINIIQNFMQIHTVDRASDDRLSIKQMLKRAQGIENHPGEDEGIPGHNPGSANLEQKAGSNVLQRLKLGPLPLEPDLLGDIVAELEEEDSNTPPREGQPSLSDHFNTMIKVEETDEAPDRMDLPLPPSRARDVLIEVQKVKDNRDRLKIETRTGGVPPPFSVCMYTFHNTNDCINCIEISGDNQLIAAGMGEHYIRVWKMDGKPLPSSIEGSLPQASRRLIGHFGPVYNLSFSPSIEIRDHGVFMTNGDGAIPRRPSTSSQYLLSASGDKTIRLWDLSTWSCLVAYEGHMGPVWDIAWGPFGYYFLTGSRDGTARLWSTDHKSDLRMFVGHDKDVNCIAFHPNNAYVFTAGYDKTVRMWAVMTGFAVRMFTGHTSFITSMACSGNGKILATGDDGGTVIMWDLGPGRLLKRLRGHDRGGVYSLAFSAESTVLISGGSDGTVRLWDVQTAADGQQGKIAGQSGAGQMIDMSGQGATGKKKGKEAVVSADQISAFPTKKSPVYKVKFTRTNLAVAAGAYLP